jgi:hypothetical protein
MMQNKFALSLPSWVFVVTILWIGFVLSISFMEAPLKFYAPSLTLPVALEIGYIVFHALNYVEILFAGLIILAACFGCPSRKTLLFTLSVVLMLVAQTILLYTKLDARTIAIINGLEIPSTPYHIIYIGIEFIKLLLLSALAFYQLKDFKGFVVLSEGGK